MADFRLGPIAVAALSGLLGGGVGALLTVAVLRGSPPHGDTHAQPEPHGETPRPTQSALDGRVTSLERALQALALRESMARAAAPQPSAGAIAGEKPPVADVAPIVDNPVFEAAVRDVMDRAEQERDVEREAQREEWRKQAAEVWVSDVSEKLRLTEMQKAKVAEVAKGFWEHLRDLRQSDAGPPPSRQQWRERVDALRKSAEADLAKVLDPGQLTSYRELDEASQLGSQRNLRGGQRGGRRGNE